MTPSKLRPTIQRLAYKPDEAAAALGLGRTSFDRLVRPHIRAVRDGAIRLYPVSELQRWIDEHAERPLPKDEP